MWTWTMLRMNGSALGESGAPDTRRGLRTGCCARSVVSGNTETGERSPGLNEGRGRTVRISGV
jgi:hypothetical protein